MLRVYHLTLFLFTFSLLQFFNLWFCDVLFTDLMVGSNTFTQIWTWEDMIWWFFLKDVCWRFKSGFAALFGFLLILVRVSTVGVGMVWDLLRGWWSCTNHQPSYKLSALRAGKMFWTKLKWRLTPVIVYVWICSFLMLLFFFLSPFISHGIFLVSDVFFVVVIASNLGLGFLCHVFSFRRWWLCRWLLKLHFVMMGRHMSRFVYRYFVNFQIKSSSDRKRKNISRNNFTRPCLAYMEK